MEAQCVGLPVVATAVGGTSEVADPRLNELVSQSPTLAEVSAAILRAAVRDRADARDRRVAWARSFNSEINYESFSRELAGMVR
jgi:glycosyltransferase involved in cell wall biosynthesis